MCYTPRQALLHAAIGVFALCGGDLIHAQTITTGDVAGVVRDPSGAIIPAATVTLKSAERGDTRTVLTGDQGAYHFNFLKPGIYTVSATTSELKSDMTKITVAVGRAIAVDLVAKLQALQEVVEIRAVAQIMATEMPT